MADETQTEKKQFRYKGKSMEELKALDIREFAKYLKARPKKFVLRHFQEIENFVHRSKETQAKNKPIKTHKRDLVIVPSMVGMRIQIHQGRNYTPTDITEEMLGHKLGEFAPTRNKVKHGKAGIGATKGSKAKAK
ncbi:ribosomal protein S19 family protein [Candidatus Pacearchaeota archaeon]|nr:ribosomal protein S19 family protein [Candidatus Pacearchaeota archaeon]